MKKLIFLFAFAFIGQQAFSQMCIVMVNTMNNTSHPSGCLLNTNSPLMDRVMTTVLPSGVINYTCLYDAGNTSSSSYESAISILNLEFNSMLSQGYTLVATSADADIKDIRGVWYFAIPWTSSGLEEVTTTLKSFIISPNPANTFVDVSLDYNLKGESEVVFISEAGYISHKQSIGNISKNEKYNIDISKIPAGKYLVTIVNGKTYTTPQKLIVL